MPKFPEYTIKVSGLNMTIRPEHFQLPDTTPEYAVYRFRHPGGKIYISVVEEKTDQTWVLEDLFIYEMLRHFELELIEPSGEEIIDYCIDQGVIPFPYEVYVYQKRSELLRAF